MPSEVTMPVCSYSVCRYVCVCVCLSVFMFCKWPWAFIIDFPLSWLSWEFSVHFWHIFVQWWVTCVYTQVCHFHLEMWPELFCLNESLTRISWGLTHLNKILSLERPLLWLSLHWGRYDWCQDVMEWGCEVNPVAVDETPKCELGQSLNMSHEHFI